MHTKNSSWKDFPEYFQKIEYPDHEEFLIQSRLIRCVFVTNPGYNLGIIVTYTGFLPELNSLSW